MVGGCVACAQLVVCTKDKVPPSLGVLLLSFLFPFEMSDNERFPPSPRRLHIGEGAPKSGDGTKG